MKLLIGLVLSSLCTFASAASNFDSLPNSTVLNMRIPNGSAAAAVLKNTKAYQVLCNAQRWQGLVDLIKKNAGSEFDEMMDALAVFNLKPEDFSTLFTGETGVALALHPAVDSGDPLVTAVMYLETDADLADRLMQAIDQVIVLNQNDDGAPQVERNDYEVGDHSVIELSNPNEDVSFFINRSGNALSIFLGMKKGLDQTKEFIVEHLDARAGDGNANGFAQTVLNTPGLADAIPAGQSIMEVTFNPQAALAIIPEDDMATPAMAGAEVRNALGLQCFKPGMLVTSMDGNIMHSGMFMGCSTPLEGIARLFEFPEIDGGPVAWAPSNVVNYAHTAVNLQHVYKVITETAVAVMGPAGQAKVQEINNAPMLFLGSDLETFLGNFGEQIVMFDYGKKAPEGVGANQMMGSFSDRVAIVWEMNDTTAMKQLLPLLQQQAAMFGGMAAEEQGASGVRVNMSMMQPGLEAGFFVTDSKLILAMGVGVTELALSAVQNPPPLAESLAASQLVKDAHALMAPKKGFIYMLQDTDAAMEAEFNVMHQEFERLSKMSPEVSDMLRLMPTGEEMKGVMGAGVSHGYRDADGIYVMGAVIMGMQDDEAGAPADAP